MFTIKLVRRSGIMLSMLCAASQAYATNGLNLNGYGARSTAMGGVGYAANLDAVTASVVNPAGAAHLEDRFDAGILLLNPQRRAACCNAPDGAVSDKDFFLIPNMGVIYKLDDDMTLTGSFVGKGGGRTQYPANFLSPGNDPLGVNLEIGEMAGGISWKMDETNSFGAALVIAMQRFVARGLQAFQSFSAEPSKLTNNQHDWSFGGGVRLGWQGRYMNGDLVVGAAYTSIRYMTKFDKYSGLFAEQGNFDLPSDYGVGVSYRLDDDWRVAFDWQRVIYTDSAAVSNATLPISAASNDPRNMGRDNGPGFGWKDTDIFKLGVDYQYDPQIKLMFGINYGETPINDNDGGGELEFNVLAPATTELHLSVGGSYKMGDHEFVGTFWHAPKNTQTQQIPIGTGLPFEDQEVLIEMRQWAWEAGYTYRF